MHREHRAGPHGVLIHRPLGVTIRGELWSCVEVPGSADLFGTGRALRVVAQIDDQPITAGLMPTGSGGHMLSVSAKLRAKLGKEIGDTVTVRVSERLT